MPRVDREEGGACPAAGQRGDVVPARATAVPARREGRMPVAAGEARGYGWRMRVHSRPGCPSRQVSGARLFATCLASLVACHGPSTAAKGTDDTALVAVCDSAEIDLRVGIGGIDTEACGEPPRNLTATVSVFREGTLEEVSSQGDVREGAQAEFHLETGTYGITAGTEDWYLDNPDSADGAPDYCRCQESQRDVAVVCGGAASEVVFQMVCEAITWG